MKPVCARMRHIVAFAICMAAYASAVVWLASIKHIGFDEVFTMRIGMLPSVPDIWHAMLQGVGDTNPPLMHILAHWTMQTPLPLEFALRLAPMTGYGVMVVCVYYFAKKRVSHISAILAVIIALCTIYYAVEARIYGVELGLLGIALLLWRAAIESKRPVSGSIALALCLSALTFSHFYAFMLIIPFIFAEEVRWRAGTRIISPVSAALAWGLLFTLTLIPFMLVYADRAGNFWAPFRATSSIRGYLFLLGFPLSMALYLGIFHTIAQSGQDRRANRQATEERSFPPHERALIIGLLCLPLLVHGLSIFTNVFVSRYVIGLIVGSALFGAWVMEDIIKRGRKYAFGFLGAVLMGVACAIISDVMYIINNTRNFHITLDTLEEHSLRHPEYALATHNYHLYMELLTYLKRETQNHFTWLESASSESITLDIQKIYPINTANRRDYKLCTNAYFLTNRVHASNVIIHSDMETRYPSANERQ